MAQETNQSQTPLLCSTGCGFYGSPRNDGMCSVCYKDFLQRHNSNGCIGPPGSSPADSSIGESLLKQCCDSTTVTSPAAISSAHTEPGHCSGPTTASATSTGESTSGAKTSLTADCLHSSGMSDRAAAVGSVQEGQCSAGSSGTELSNSTSVRKCSHKGKKRKLEDPEENIDVKRASGCEVSVDTPAEAEGKSKAKKNRCFTCRKKVGLTGFDCRCGNVFCSMHRYSDVHNCTFDYKADGAERIRRENPVIVREKIQKI
ncbi:AN1-type zinc finger protein 6 [Lates calcarifer]|uniref:AN1-type zinc finger protein 6 n=1 Tax=Lates calcarifer TaxID=8187 RepID=A0A4W6D1Z8_LATCA|nr:AN1-type zinc finger protein 6 [Lates calcarifer]XP_018548339.1 AN1-type zinc finger protein 6 [Lates calcarifer]